MWVLKQALGPVAYSCGGLARMMPLVPVATGFGRGRVFCGRGAVPALCFFEDLLVFPGMLWPGRAKRGRAGMCGVQLMAASSLRLCARPASRNSLVALCRPRRLRRRSPPRSLRLACRPSMSGARRL